MRGQWGLEPAQVLYLRRVKAMLDGTAAPLLDTTQTPPSFTVRPTLAQVETWFARDLSAGVAVDIECAGHLLVAIGFCDYTTEEAICVPFRRQGGDPYWTDPDEAAAAARCCGRVLADPAIPKIFHNGQTFDVPELESYGFQVEGYVDDTLVMSHTTYPDMPKRLNFLGTLYGGLPEWKYLVKQGEEEDDTK